MTLLLTLNQRAPRASNPTKSYWWSTRVLLGPRPPYHFMKDCTEGNNIEDQFFVEDNDAPTDRKPCSHCVGLRRAVLEALNQIISRQQ